MTQRNAIRLVATGARLLVGAVVAVGCVVGVTAAAAAPWPQVDHQPAQTRVSPTPGDTVLVCNGAFRALGRDTRDVSRMFAAGTPALTSGAASRPEQLRLAVPDLGDVSGAPVYTAPAEGGESPLVAASESISLAEEDLTGLASAACREPSTESWLIGGAVSTGAGDVVVLSNPGEVPATLTLTVYGGEQEQTSSTVVPAHTQVAVPLASVAAGRQQPIVRVTATGSPVRAVLQSSLVRTLDPAGIDLQDSAGAPERRLGFAGVQVVAPASDSATTLLRLLSPEGASEATVIVRGAGDGSDARFTVPLAQGAPVEVDLSDLAIGTYQVDVEADAPITGAIWQTSGIGPGTDFAWMTPAPQLERPVAVAVPDGPSPRLHVVNSGDADATVTLRPVDGGESVDTVVPAGGSELVTVVADTTYILESTAPVRAAVTLTAPNALAGWPVWPAAGEQEPITVYP